MMVEHEKLEDGTCIPNGGITMILRKTESKDVGELTTRKITWTVTE